MSYIEKEAALEFVLNNTPHINGETTMKCVERAIKEMPTADVVEVVRCKDCKHRNTPDCKMWYQCVICGDYHHWERDEDYCSLGERREENEE